MSVWTYRSTLGVNSTLGILLCRTFKNTTRATLEKWPQISSCPEMPQWKTQQHGPPFQREVNMSLACLARSLQLRILSLDSSPFPPATLDDLQKSIHATAPTATGPSCCGIGLSRVARKTTKHATNNCPQTSTDNILLRFLSFFGKWRSSYHPNYTHGTNGVIRD